MKRCVPPPADQADNDDEEAVEARDWHDEWAVAKQQDESNNNQRSQE